MERERQQELDPERDRGSKTELEPELETKPEEEALRAQVFDVWEEQ